MVSQAAASAYMIAETLLAGGALEEMDFTAP
jgi:hypothetical protein